MTLDATMIGICCIIFILFHPHLVMGSSIAIGLRSIAKNKDQETGDNLNKEKINDIVSDNEESTLQGQNVFRGEPNQEYKE